MTTTMRSLYWTKGGGATPETAITVIDFESNEVVAQLMRQADHKEDQLADSIKALPLMHEAIGLFARFRAGEEGVTLEQVFEALAAAKTAARW